MFDTKTSAVVLALLGVVVYESTSKSNRIAGVEKQNELLQE
jgi:Tfp pilus assembly protein PilX